MMQVSDRPDVRLVSARGESLSFCKLFFEANACYHGNGSPGEIEAFAVCVHNAGLGRMQRHHRFIGPEYITVRLHGSAMRSYATAAYVFTDSSQSSTGLNNEAKLTTRKAYGFRTFEAIEIALYHTLGKLPEPEIHPQILLRKLIVRLVKEQSPARFGLRSQDRHPGAQPP